MAKASPSLPPTDNVLRAADLAELNKAQYLVNDALAKIDAIERAGGDVEALRLARDNVATLIASIKAEYFPGPQSP